MFTDAIAWVCRSPRRLAVTAATVLVVVLVGGSALFGNGTDGPAQVTDRPASTPTVAGAQVPDAAPYVSAAVAFAGQWSALRPNETAAGWLARLTPLATPDLIAALKTTDPANLPGVPPEGEPVVRFVSQTSALVAIPLADGTSVLVSVVLGGQQPLVSDVQPNLGD